MRLTFIIRVEMLNSQGQNYFDNIFKRIGLFVFGKISQLSLIVLAFLLVIFVIVEILWDVYFVLDGSKCNYNFMKQNCIDTLVGVVIPVSNTVIWDTSTHVDLMKMPKKYITWCNSLDWWLFHTGSVVSIQVFIRKF